MKANTEMSNTAHENYMSDNLATLYDMWSREEYGYPLSRAIDIRQEYSDKYAMPFISFRALQTLMIMYKGYDNE